jgi:hypothetical protein
VSGCYGPHQFLVAYGIQPLIDRGTTGHGVTVVLPEEAETGPARPQPVTDLVQSVTDIRGDPAVFDSRFRLPPARVQVIKTKALAGSSASPWLAGVEEVEDTEMVHAVAPDATIRELLVDPAGVSTPAKFAATFAAYVRTAVSNGEVMSQSGIGQDFNVGESSWTSAEVAAMNSALEYYRIAQGPLYHRAFHDITTGNNTVSLNGATVTGYQAGTGWAPSPAGGLPMLRSSSPSSSATPAHDPRPAEVIYCSERLAMTLDPGYERRSVRLASLGLSGGARTRTCHHRDRVARCHCRRCRSALSR